MYVSTTLPAFEIVERLAADLGHGDKTYETVRAELALRGTYTEGWHYCECGAELSLFAGQSWHRHAAPLALALMCRRGFLPAGSQDEAERLLWGGFTGTLPELRLVLEAVAA